MHALHKSDVPLKYTVLSRILFVRRAVKGLSSARVEVRRLEYIASKVPIFPAKLCLHSNKGCAHYRHCVCLLIQANSLKA